MKLNDRQIKLITHDGKGRKNFKSERNPVKKIVKMFKDRSDAERFSKFEGSTGHYIIKNKRGKLVTVKPNS